MEVKDLATVLQKIYSEISWYHSVGMNSQDINSILNCKDRLAIYSYGLAQYASEVKMEYNICYFNRKIAVSKTTHGLIMNSGYSKAKAEDEALLANQELMRKEIEKEGEAFKVDLLLKQANVIIQSMQQRVSFLRMESEYANKQQEQP